METFITDLSKTYDFIKPCVLKGWLCGENRPSVLIFPGGGYGFVSERESEPVATRFLQNGYNAFVLYYSIGKDAVYPMPLLQAVAALLYIKNNKDTLKCNDDVITCGFSAGGHLAAMTAVFYDRDILLSKFNISGQQAKPSAVILCYPVISALHSPHLGSFINLSGSNNFKEHISYSAELAVSADTPPSFIWHTAQDNAVGVQNSLVFAANLAKCGVPFEMHIFEKGPHGLSMCDNTTSENNPQMENPDAAKWFEMCINWLDNRFGS